MTEKYVIKTLVIEDEEKLRNHIRGKIQELDPTFQVVATAENGKAALEMIEEIRPHVIFTDICMPVMGGMELIKKIRQIMPSTIIVILSGYSDFSYAQEAIRYSVFNYLLKPLEDDKLLEALFDIKQSLSYQGLGRKRHISYSDNYQLVSFAAESFFVFSVCVGTMIHNVLDEEINDFYMQRMKPISWNKIMSDICSEGQEWLVIDEHAVNQKIIEIKVNEMSQQRKNQILHYFMNAIQEQTELPVTLCTGTTLVLKEDLQDYVRRLRNAMRNKLVIGESRIIELENEEKQRNDIVEIVKMKLNQYFKNYFITKDFDVLIQEMERILKYMKSNHTPQISVERIYGYILRMLELSDQGYEKEMLSELSEEMIESISMITEEDVLFEKLLKSLQSVKFCFHLQETESSIAKVLEYVDDNFYTIDCIEDVAEKFGYNYAYLSRVFKKKVGESMNKYITNKKISLAKKLMETKPELRLTEISELCGYNDSRYFSRVFKKETGINPSVYKEGL